ncbi:MAG: glycosyltransferase family 4 protein [Rhodanobacteraceae bacterium]
MKILYHHRIASKDGQYVHIEGVVNALRALGHEVMLTGPELEESRSFGGESGWVRWLKRWTPGALYEVAEFGYSVLDYFRLSRAIRLYRPDFVYERYNLFFLSGLWARRRHRLPWLVEVNAPLFDERCAHGGIRLKWLARWSERSVWRGADHVFAVTQVLARRIEREGVDPARLTVTPNSVDTAVFERLPSRADAKRSLGLEAKVVLGFTGFVREWHGLERVLDAMQRLDVPSHVVLVGDGPARAALEQRAHALGLAANITFTGVVERSRLIGFVNAFDIALQPDVVAYASPLKLFEYLAAGCAIVAPDRPNIREILVHDVNAWLFDPDDPDSFVDAVATLANDTALRQRLANAAKATIQQKNLTWAGNAERILACARALIVSPRAASVRAEPGTEP